MLHMQRPVIFHANGGFRPVAFSSAAPAPCVAKPDSGQHGQRSRIRAAIRNSDANQNVVFTGLGVLRGDIEITPILKRVGIGNFKLAVQPATLARFLQQLLIRKRSLRILIQRLHIGMCGRGIQVVIQLFYIFPMVPFRPGQPEEPLLQNRVLPIPKRQRKAQPPFAIADTEQAIFAPAIRPAARMIVRQIAPALAGGGVIFPHRAPLTLRQIRPPPFPIGLARRVVS